MESRNTQLRGWADRRIAALATEHKVTRTAAAAPPLPPWRSQNGGGDRAQEQTHEKVVQDKYLPSQI